MSIIDAIPAAVQTINAVEPIVTGDWTDALINDPSPRVRARGFALLAARESAPVELDPAADAPADAPEPFTPTPEDAEWWAAVCDHSDWPRDGELSPDEQEVELATLDRYNDALSAMFEEAAWLDRYAVC